MTAYTSRNPLVIVKSGVTTRLDQIAYNVSLRKVAHLAGQRGQVLALPGKSGSVFQKGRQRDDGVVILEMWAQDTDADGGFVADPYLQWRSNMDTLLRLFDTQQGQITLREYTTKLSEPSISLPSTGYREALCEVRTAIDPELVADWLTSFKVELIINDVYWRDYQDTTFTSPTGGSAVATHTMSGFAGGTAPIEDSVICVDGPIANPKVTDIVSGHSVNYTGTVSNGTQWVVDSALWASVTGTSLDFNVASGTNVTASTIAQGTYSPRLFAVTASASGPQVSLSGTGTGANTRLRIKGRRKFH